MSFLFLFHLMHSRPDVSKDCHVVVLPQIVTQKIKDQGR